jgi:hypothetical protein
MARVERGQPVEHCGAVHWIRPRLGRRQDQGAPLFGYAAIVIAACLGHQAVKDQRAKAHPLGFGAANALEFRQRQLRQPRD